MRNWLIAFLQWQAKMINRMYPNTAAGFIGRVFVIAPKNGVIVSYFDKPLNESDLCLKIEPPLMTLEAINELLGNSPEIVGTKQYQHGFIFGNAKENLENIRKPRL